jgi:hypothetical protein
MFLVYVNSSPLYTAYSYLVPFHLILQRQSEPGQQFGRFMCTTTHIVDPAFTLLCNRPRPQRKHRVVELEIMREESEEVNQPNPTVSTMT